MINLGKKKIDSRIHFQVLTDSLTSHLSAVRVSGPSVFIRIRSGCDALFQIITEWLVGEHDNASLSDFDVLHIGEADCSWYTHLGSEEVTP